MRNFIAGVLVLLSVVGCSDEKGLLSPAEMKEDIQFYFHLIRDIHPDPYHRYDSMTFVALETKMIEACSVPMTVEDFGFRLMKTRKFLDGHAGVSGLSAEGGYYCLPSVEFKHGKMLLGNDTLLAVRDSFASFTALDIDSMIPWDQPVRIRNENMNLFLKMLLAPANRSTVTYTGTLETANGIRDTIIRVEPYRKKKNSVYTKPYVSTFYPEESIAVLYYNTCMIYGEDNVKHYKGFVDTFFSEVKSKDIKTVFIDVTHNGGGSDGNNSAILNHLKGEQYNVRVKMKGKKAGVEKFCQSDLTKQFFADNKAEGAQWVETFGYPIMETGVAFHEEFVPANDSGYQGKVFVLMGNSTYSAGANFCWSAKLSNAATLVGEAAGQYYPICGSLLLGTLPNSKIQYQMPTIQTFREPSALFEDGYIYPEIAYPVSDTMGVADYKKILSLSAGF